MPESLGEFLQHRRVQEGLSLEDISQKTRIDARYLRALEENDFANVPRGQVIAKAYLRAFARCLSIQEEEVMTRFAETAGPYYKKRTELSQVKKPAMERAGDHMATKLNKAYSRLKVLLKDGKRYVRL
jgi:cytoskeletal protein RodZ